MTSETSADRRAAPRQKSTLNRFILADLTREDVETRQVYVFIVDLSEGGLRLHADWEAPADATFHLRFPVDSFGANLTGELCVTLQVVWSKVLEGGTFAHGLQFVEPDEATLRTVRQVMEHFEESRHELYPLDEAVPLTLVAYGHEHPTVARKLSRAALAFRTKVPLHEGDGVGLTLRLGPTFGRVQTRGRVAWVRPLDEELAEVRCEFLELSEQDARRITSFIDDCQGQKRRHSSFSWDPPESRKHLR